MKLLSVRSLTLRPLFMLVSTLLAGQPAFGQMLPGWYSNGPGVKIGTMPSKLEAIWKNSYVYSHPERGLYLYAQVVFFNNGSKSISLSCKGEKDPSVVKMRTQGGEWP
jgi:hypothetical protein